MYALEYFGLNIVLLISLSCYCIRLYYYSMLGYNFFYFSNAWCVLPIELLHGLTYAWTASSIAILSNKFINNYKLNNNIKNIKKSQLYAFSQSFLHSIFTGIGQITGILISGYLYFYYNPHYAFLWNALLLTPFIFVLIFKSLYDKCKN